MKLHEVMRLHEPCRVAVVGAGGKTSTIWRLAESISGKVVITTTTHLGLDQIEKAENLFITGMDEIKNFDWGKTHRIISVTGPAVDGHRIAGLTSEQSNQLYQSSIEHKFSILIEADGARMLPLKAPGEHEPVIPEWLDTVIVVTGMSTLGQVLNEKNVFRVKEFSQLSGIPEGGQITGDGISKVVCSPDGGLKGIPGKARRILVLNQSENLELHPDIMRIANNCKNIYDHVLITSIGYQQKEPIVYARVEPIAAIILAAGGSSRLNGQPKPLVEFQGEMLVRRAVRTAIQAELSPVVVVTGYKSEKVIPTLASMNVDAIENLDWANGQSTSIRAGIQQLRNRCGAAIFMLVDQPFVSVELLEALIKQYQTTFAPIIAPMMDDKRSNPVLFDRVTFDELSKLEGDTGGRAILGHFDHAWLPWLDKRILMDIDTAEDLERCKNAA
jgi:molybdenum cofactor cytidylyltransferase